MSKNSPAGLQIDAVGQLASINDFIDVPWMLYGDDPHWVPPLRFEIKQRLNVDKNPFFEHARWQGWVARRDGQLVGRISAQVDQLHQQRYGDNTGYFGMIESEKNPQTTEALFAVAENWLREQGMARVCGPLNLSINEEVGLLVEGFDTPPQIMMGHSLPYLGSLVEAAGYSPAQELLAYDIHPDFEVPRVMASLAKRASKRIKVRPLNRKQLAQDLGVIRDIFNDAWSDNWGYVPWTDAEFKDIGEMMTLLMPDEMIQIAELDGEPVAFIVAMPNVNEAARDLNGRLLPFGWAKLLWRLKVKFPSSARIPLMGVRKEYQHTRLGPTLAFMVIDEVRKPLIKRGVSNVEMSWILEGNEGMRNIIEVIGGKIYKRYRIYEKTL